MHRLCARRPVVCAQIISHLCAQTIGTKTTLEFKIGWSYRFYGHSNLFLGKYLCTNDRISCTFVHKQSIKKNSKVNFRGAVGTSPRRLCHGFGLNAVVGYRHLAYVLQNDFGFGDDRISKAAQTTLSGLATGLNYRRRF